MVVDHPSPPSSKSPSPLRSRRLWYTTEFVSLPTNVSVKVGSEVLIGEPTPFDKSAIDKVPATAEVSKVKARAEDVSPTLPAASV